MNNGPDIDRYQAAAGAQSTYSDVRLNRWAMGTSRGPMQALPSSPPYLPKDGMVVLAIVVAGLGWYWYGRRKKK